MIFQTSMIRFHVYLPGCIIIIVLIIMILSSCWWKKILHHWGCIIPLNNEVNYLSTGTGFLPSTVLLYDMYIPGPSKKCHMDKNRCQPPLGGCWYIPLRQFPKPNKECVCFCTFFFQDDPCKGFPSTKGPKLWYTHTNICFAVQSRHADFDEGI